MPQNFLSFLITNHILWQGYYNKMYIAGNHIDCLPYKIANVLSYYSNSIVPGGLLVKSYMTRFTPFTSLMIRLVTLKSTS